MYLLSATTGVRRGNRVDLCEPSGHCASARLAGPRDRCPRPGASTAGRSRCSPTAFATTACRRRPRERPRIRTPLATGVHAIDALLTCGRGQRLGIFSGSGVGKSVLLGMMSRGTDADVIVTGLIGERGREVNEFVERDLGPEGLARSVVVVATSNEPALARPRRLHRDGRRRVLSRPGQTVLLLMDSITRFAMAQREIGLAAGEPPTTRGYPPSMFALLPRLVERAGQSREGSITAFYTRARRRRRRKRAGRRHDARIARRARVAVAQAGRRADITRRSTCCPASAD